jgi:hypothetical protein
MIGTIYKGYSPGEVAEERHVAIVLPEDVAGDR